MPPDLLRALAASLAIIVWFDVDWCMSTTFRAMSDWLMWVDTLLAALVLALPYALTRRRWVLLTTLILAAGVCEANLMYCRTYLTAIPPESYLLASNLGDFTASVVDSLRWADLGFVVILALTAVLMPRRDRGEARPTGGLRAWLAATTAAAAVATVGIAARGGFYKAYDSLVQQCYYSTCGVPTYTIAGHIVYSVIDASCAAEGDMRPAIDAWIARHDSMVARPSLPAGVKPRRNLVLIVLESFESWPVGARVNGREITPYINSLVADSTTFYAPNILTQVASGRSIDCQLLVNAGLLPMNGSVYSMKYPSSTYPTVNKALRADRGTRSIIFTCDKPITWNQLAISRAFGYDSLIDRSAWRMDEMVGNPAKLSDGSFLRQSVAKIEREGLWPAGEPRMLTFITYSGHNPFKLPESMRDPAFDISGLGLPQTLADYVTMAHYTDSQLHVLVDYLKSRPDWAETLVVIIGDHEGLAGSRHDIVASGGVASQLVSPGQYTPLIVLNAPVAGRDDRTAGQIDIYPTLLGMLGLDSYSWHGMGQNILDKSRRPFAISSMTGEEVADGRPDTAFVSLMRQARRVSDAAIRTDYFNRPDK